MRQVAESIGLFDTPHLKNLAARAFLGQGFSRERWPSMAHSLLNAFLLQREAPPFSAGSCRRRDHLISLFQSAVFHFSVFAALAAVVHADERIPTGFKVGRYTRLWERNPFTEVAPG